MTQSNPPQTTNWSQLSFGVMLGWLAAYHYFKLPPVLPLLLQQYAFDPLLGGAFMSVFALAGLLVSAWIGRHLNRLGAPLLLATACSMMLAGSLTALAWPASPLLMMLSRSTEALGYAILAVVGVILTLAAASPGDRPLAAGLWATWIPAGQILAAGLTALLNDHGDWRHLWSLGLMFTMAMVFWGWWLQRRGSFCRPRNTDSEARPADAADAGQRLTVLASIAVFALWSAQFIAFMTWLPQFMMETHGLDMATMAGSYALVPAMIIICNLAAAVLLRAGLGVGGLMAVALTVQTLVWFMLPHVTSLSAGITGLVCYGMASGIVPTCLFSLPHHLADSPQRQARIHGLLMAGRNLGALLGPVLLPQVKLLTGGWNGVMSVFGMFTMGALCSALYVSLRLAAKHPR